MRSSGPTNPGRRLRTEATLYRTLQALKNRIRGLLLPPANSIHAFRLPAREHLSSTLDTTLASVRQLRQSRSSNIGFDWLVNIALSLIDRRAETKQDI